MLIGIQACTAGPPPVTAERVPAASTAEPGEPRQPSPTSSPMASLTATPRPAPTLTPSPAPTGTPPAMTPACWERGGRMEIHTLRTDLSPWPWEFRVYLPPCYDQEPERRYPTLILIHGSTFNDDQWDRLGADEVADELIAAGEIPPFLILMPRDRRWVEPREDPFGEALVDHILPWLDENYRTIPQREYRAIGGLSRGAAWAVHLGLSRWELFSAIGGHSLPVFRSDSPYLRDWLTEIPPESLPRIYMDIGESDYLIEAAVWFESLLNELDIPHEWYLYPGRHEESYWESHMERYLRWYTQEWGGGGP